MSGLHRRDVPDDRHGVFIPSWAVAECNGDYRDAALLSQITFWLQPSQRAGAIRTQHVVERFGCTWLFTTDAELGRELTVSDQQIRRARNSLKSLDLIETRSSKVDNRKVTLVRIATPVDEEHGDDSATPSGFVDIDESKEPSTSTDLGNVEVDVPFLISTMVEDCKTTSPAEAVDPACPSSAALKHPETRANSVRLCNLFRSILLGNGIPASRVKVTETWLVECDRLQRIDGYSPQTIAAVMRFATTHHFWRNNIQSLDSLRKQFPRLNGVMADEATGQGRRQPSRSAFEEAKRLDGIQ